MSMFYPSPIVQVIAKNLRDAMERRKDRYPSTNALAKACGVAPNTVKNMLYPESRAPTARGESSPNIDKLDKVARVLGMQTWELLYPNSQDESEMGERYKILMDSIRSSFAEIERMDKARRD